MLGVIYFLTSGCCNQFVFYIFCVSVCCFFLFLFVCVFVWLFFVFFVLLWNFAELWPYLKEPRRPDEGLEWPPGHLPILVDLHPSAGGPPGWFPLGSALVELLRRVALLLIFVWFLFSLYLCFRVLFCLFINLGGLKGCAHCLSRHWARNTPL